MGFNLSYAEIGFLMKDFPKERKVKKRIDNMF